MILRFVRISLLVVFATALAGQVHAQSDQGLDSRVFGLGQPASVADLPPGQLKRKINLLPPQARSNALKWLQGISFAIQDVATLDVDTQGGIYYVDSVVIEQTDEAESAGESGPEAASASTLDDAFVLHSRPGAPNTVFVDFDGHVFTATAWGSGTFYARAYDLDGDPDTFNSTERTKIVDIWHRIAEDLLPFDIDVTTEEPSSFDRYTGRLLITHSQQTTGSNMPYANAGGVAYVNVFGASNYHTYYSPALVYFNNLGNGFEHYVAEASTHEFGHNLGLSHDGTTTGADYYRGHGSGLVSWAPIMGVGYDQNVTQWSKGEYANANQPQDDLAIINGKLGYVLDDHGDSIAAASTLDIAVDGSVVSSNPEFDPHNILPENKGVIGDSSDVDIFSFIAGTGTVNLSVTPAWDAFPRTNRRGANLDIGTELRDVNGVLVASSDPLDNTNASITVSVSNGAYYLLISGVGNAVTPYSDYNSLGQYFINGSVPPAAADETKPTPNPMAFASAPAAISASEISMTAVIATDDISAVQYNFRCTAAGGGQGCVNSGWQAGTGYTATGLAADTQYTFTVSATDQSGNETTPSSPASATTDAPPPWVDYVSSSETLVAGAVSSTHMVTHSSDGAAEAITERESGGKPKNRYTYLEHRWNFNISAGASVTVYAQAWMSGSNPGESFNLEYSLNGSSYTPLMNIYATSSANEQTANISDTSGGTLILRVKNAHQASGERNKSTFHVDHLYIRVDNGTGEPPPSDPPAAPTGMTATAVSSNAINLTWTDASDDEMGFKVERSSDGLLNWVVIADLGAGMDAHGDAGLDAATQYFYRVSAFNSNGSLGYASAEATTAESGLELSATGSKSKGKHVVTLSWPVAMTVDVYRDGSLVGPPVTGKSFEDSTGQKGGATYEHQVCESGGDTNCSNVTSTIF